MQPSHPKTAASECKQPWIKMDFAGLIIIRFKSVKAFSQISPRRRGVKNPFVVSVPWQRACLPGDSGYDRGECACVIWDGVYIYTYRHIGVCASGKINMHAYLWGIWMFANFRVTGAHRLTNRHARVMPFLLFFFRFQERISRVLKVSCKRMQCSSRCGLWNWTHRKLSGNTEDQK